MEMKTLAEEYKAAYTNLFDSLEKVVFRHTNEQRFTDSCIGFSTALFDSDGVEDDTSDTDMLLKVKTFYMHAT